MSKHLGTKTLAGIVWMRNGSPSRFRHGVYLRSFFLYRGESGEKERGGWLDE